jgi:hypothetical protein
MPVAEGLQVLDAAVIRAAATALAEHFGSQRAAAAVTDKKISPAQMRRLCSAVGDTIAPRTISGLQLAHRKAWGGGSTALAQSVVWPDDMGALMEYTEWLGAALRLHGAPRLLRINGPSEPDDFKAPPAARQPTERDRINRELARLRRQVDPAKTPSASPEVRRRIRELKGKLLRLPQPAVERPAGLTDAAQVDGTGSGAVFMELSTHPVHRQHFDAFLTWCRGHGYPAGLGKARVRLAILRVVEPLAASLRTGMEWGWEALASRKTGKSDLLDGYLKAAFRREKALLQRRPNEQRLAGLLDAGRLRQGIR